MRVMIKFNDIFLIVCVCVFFLTEFAVTELY